MQDRQSQAVEQLRIAKSQGLSYFDATQGLLKQGFSKEEVEQASYQFPYSDTTPTSGTNDTASVAMNQALAEAVVHQEAVDHAKQELHKDIAGTLLGGRSVMGSYYSSKAIGDYAALKDLQQGKLADNNPNGKPPGAGSVFRRNRAVRIYAFGSLLPLLFLGPYFWLMLHDIHNIVAYLLHHHNATAFASVGMYLWSASGYVAYITIALVLFFARKESTIARTIYMIMGIDAVLFLLFAVLFKSPVFLMLGVVTLIPAYWISKRVGLLMQLSESK